MKKRIICMSLALALIVGQVYAVDFSWGGSFGFGKAIFRGEDAENTMDIVENWTEEEAGLFSISPIVQADLIIGISPYFAVETGIGFRSYIAGWETGKKSLVIASQTVILPVMARGKYDIGILSVYAAIGPKFIIPLTIYDYYTYAQTGYKNSAVKMNLFLMDLGFAIGAEVKLGKFHIGLRGNYDLNLISPIKSINGVDQEWFHDNLSLSITIRDVAK